MGTVWLTVPTPTPRSVTNQLFPSAAQSSLKTDCGRDQNVGLTCFNLLERADVEIGRLRELLLCHLSSDPLTAQIAAEAS